MFKKQVSLFVSFLAFANNGNANVQVRYHSGPVFHTCYGSGRRMTTLEFELPQHLRAQCHFLSALPAAIRAKLSVLGIGLPACVKWTFSTANEQHYKPMTNFSAVPVRNLR